MNKEICPQVNSSTYWHELYARAINYKDKDGNYKTDYLCLKYGESRGLKQGDLFKFTYFKDTTQHIYFYITNVEDIDDEFGGKHTLLTGYWVWSVYAGCVKSVDDLPDDAHEGEYYLIKPNEKTPIKDYRYYERIGDEWKPMGSYWR